MKLAKNILLILLTILIFFWSNSLLISIPFFLIINKHILKISLPQKLKLKSSTYLYKFFNLLYWIVLPFYLAIMFRLFFIDFYFVPSSSMENTLFPKDYVVVNKLVYGTKVPRYKEDIPILGSWFNTEIHFENDDYNLFEKSSSFINPKEGDIVVFKSTNYRNKHLVKRIVGTPGDSISIVNASIIINGKRTVESENLVFNYVDSSSNSLTIRPLSNNQFNSLPKLKRNNLAKSIHKKNESKYLIFPIEKQDVWTKDNYGPVLIPRKGLTISITDENIYYYRHILKRFEDISIDKLKTMGSYTFKKDYYFVMGDNRHNSIDSRNFGFVPEDYILGKVLFSI